MSQILKPEARGNPNAIAVRIKGRNAKNVAGQRRHDLRIGAQPAYVDADKSHLNRVLIDPWTGPKLRKESETRRRRRATKRAMKSNAGIAMVGIITFGNKAQKRFERLNNADQDAVFTEIAEAIADRLNTTLTGLVIHRDESAIHAHFQLVGYTHAGDPVSDKTKKKDTSALQDLAAEIIAKYDPKIERGRRIKERLEGGAKPHEVINRQVALLHRDLPLEIEELRMEIAELRKAKAKLERYITRIEDRETRTAKQEKNLSIYERRLSTKEAELTDREARIIELEATVRDLEQRQRKAEWAADRAEKRTRDADELHDISIDALQQAMKQEQEVKARTPKVLHPNRIDDLPAPLREAVDKSARDRGYLPLAQMDDPDERIQSVSGFLRDYLFDIASNVYEAMKTQITALRRQYRNALYKIKGLEKDLQSVRQENSELQSQNQNLRAELERLTKPKQAPNNEPD